MDLVLWYFKLWVLSEPKPKWISDRTRNIQTPKRSCTKPMISIPNMYSKYIKIYKTSKILIYFMKVGGSIT